MSKASRFIIIKPSKTKEQKRLEDNNIYKEILRSHDLAGTKEPTDLTEFIAKMEDLYVSKSGENQ